MAARRVALRAGQSARSLRWAEFGQRLWQHPGGDQPRVQLADRDPRDLVVEFAARRAGGRRRMADKYRIAVRVRGFVDARGAACRMVPSERVDERGQYILVRQGVGPSSAVRRADSAADAGRGFADEQIARLAGDAIRLQVRGEREMRQRGRAGTSGDELLDCVADPVAPSVHRKPVGVDWLEADRARRQQSARDAAGERSAVVILGAPVGALPGGVAYFVGEARATRRAWQAAMDDCECKQQRLRLLESAARLGE